MSKKTKGVLYTMFKFTKKAENIEEQIELTDEQLTEVTGGGLVTGLLGGGTKTTTTAASGTSVQLGAQAAVGAAVSTEALSSTGIVGGLI